MPLIVGALEDKSDEVMEDTVVAEPVTEVIEDAEIVVEEVKDGELEEAKQS